MPTEATCPICFNPIQSYGSMRRLRCCGDRDSVYCSACLDHWFTHNRTCPRCRRPVPEAPAPRRRSAGRSCAEVLLRCLCL